MRISSEVARHLVHYHAWFYAVSRHHPGS